MKISKKKFLQILSEEGYPLLLKEEVSAEDIENIADKLLKKLDSIDMSLDLVYGALAGGARLATTRARQTALGGAMRGGPAPSTAPPPSPSTVAEQIDEEDFIILEVDEEPETEKKRSFGSKLKGMFDKAAGSGDLAGTSKRFRRIGKKVGKKMEKQAKAIEAKLQRELAKNPNFELDPAEQKHLDLYKKAKEAGKSMYDYVAKEKGAGIESSYAKLFGKRSKLDRRQKVDLLKAKYGPWAKRAYGDMLGAGEETGGTMVPSPAPEAADPDEGVKLSDNEIGLAKQIQSLKAQLRKARNQYKRAEEMQATGAPGNATKIGLQAANLTRILKPQLDAAEAKLAQIQAAKRG